MKLTAEQAATVTTAGQGYDKTEYKAAFDRIIEEAEAEGMCEDLFPKVKPAHVAFVFRNLLKSEGITDWVVTKSEDYGIVLKPLS